jgi:hypothetical protein
MELVFQTVNKRYDVEWLDPVTMMPSTYTNTKIFNVLVQNVNNE